MSLGDTSGAGSSIRGVAILLWQISGDIDVDIEIVVISNRP